jgi:hypothetical protein
MGMAKPMGWAGIAIAAWLSGQPQARADEASLSWVRLPDAEDCIGAAELAALVEQRIGRPVLQAPSRAQTSIEGRVAADGEDGWLAVIDVADRRGALVGRRELRVRGEPCSALDRPVSLIISVLIDPNAAGPALIEGDGLSPDARRLLAQLDLPSADPDEVLALLVGHRKLAPPASEFSRAPASAAGGGAKAADTPVATKMISVSEAEWRRMQALAASAPQDEVETGTPAWPGYALLGLGAAATGLTIYAIARMDDLEDDPAFNSYRDAVFRGSSEAEQSPPTDVCDEAENGRRYGVDDGTLLGARDACTEGQTLEVLGWVFAATALASTAFGGAWLIWIADDDEPASTARGAHLSLQPLAMPGVTGLRLRARL